MGGEVFAEPGITRAVAACPVREHDEWPPHAIGHDRRVLVQVQIGGQEDLERNGGRRRSGRIDQHQIQRPAALGRVDIFELRHPDGIQGGPQHVLGQRARRPGHKTGTDPETNGDASEQTSEAISAQADSSHVLPECLAPSIDGPWLDQSGEGLNPSPFRQREIA